MTPGILSNTQPAAAPQPAQAAEAGRCRAVYTRCKTPGICELYLDIPGIVEMNGIYNYVPGISSKDATAVTVRHCRPE